MAYNPKKECYLRILRNITMIATAATAPIPTPTGINIIAGASSGGGVAEGVGEVM